MRTADDVEKLLPLIREIDFFKERDIKKDHEMIEIANGLEYMNMKRGKMIFDHGSLGDMFYIIL